MRHVLSIEIEEFKREFIKSAHTVPGEQPEFCLFDDVEVLEKLVGFCYTATRNTMLLWTLMLTSLDPRAKTSAMRTQTQPSGPIATLTMMGLLVQHIAWVSREVSR